MVSKEEYNSYVKKILGKEEKVNIKSLALWYHMVAILLILVGVILCVFWFPYIFFGGYQVILFFVGVIAVIVSVSMFHIRNSAMEYYRGDFREKIIRYLLKGNEYWFDKSGYISSLEFDFSQFAKSTYDCFSSSDLLMINIPNNDGSESKINLRIADVSAYDLSVDDEGNRSTSDVYTGIFGYVTFKKKFKCILSINSKYKIKGLKLENVVLEDINFNEKFKVKSDNQVEARYILTPDMMGKIMKLEEIINGVKIVFTNKSVYIGAEDVNLFELRRYKKGDPLTVFDKLYDEIMLVLGIVEELKNNDKVFKM